MVVRPTHSKMDLHWSSPKRLADDAKWSLLAKAQTPGGKAVIGGVVVVVGLLVFRRIRRGHAATN
jgi:hypothetical protein